MIVIFTGTSHISDDTFQVFLNKMKDFPEEKTILSGCKNRFAFNDSDTREMSDEKVESILQIAKETEKGRPTYGNSCIRISIIV